MSVSIPAVNYSGLSASSNLSNPVSCTKLIWMKAAADPTVYTPILLARNGAATSYSRLYANTTLQIGSDSGFNTFGSSPTWADWTCYAYSATTAGAGSLVAYWQDNAGGGFVTQNATGTSFTNANDFIAANGNQQQMTVAYYMEWNTVLTLGQLNTQFLSATPAVALGNLRRYLVLANAASAGTDSSGNGFNMTAVGTLSDGVGNPSFAIPNSAVIAWVT